MAEISRKKINGQGLRGAFIAMIFLVFENINDAWNDSSLLMSLTNKVHGKILLPFLLANGPP